MRDRTLITTGAIGAVLAAICCMTPLLVVVFGAVGQGREPSVDLDVADLGRFCRTVPDAGLGYLDCRRLAPVAKRAADQTSNKPLVMGDAVHMPILAIPLRTTFSRGGRKCAFECHRKLGSLN